MKVYSQLEKAQLENTTSDTGSLPKGMITYRTDLNIAKVSNGTSMLALIDESSTQTLSGKTYASPNFTGAFNMAQTTTPSNPSAGSNKFYFKADGKLYTLDSSGNEALVGSGTGGVKNLITNGNADDTAASIFVPYADTGTRPVDGTGGSPTVTTAISSSTPLDGVKSFLLTKPASNVQGQGWAVPFTVDPAYRAKSLKISVDYIVNSGTFVAGTPTADSDVIWYLYDITNSTLIEPSNIKMFSNSTTLADRFEATFQTSPSGSSYRLIAHCATTSALAYELKVDNVTVGPQNYVYGTPVTDWQSYTPSTGATNTTYTGKWRRVGDTMEITVGFAFTGAPSAWGSVHIPTGYTIDTSKMGGFAQYASNLGEGMVYDNAGAAQPIHVTYFSTTQVLFTYEAATSNQIGPASATAPYTLGAGDSAQVRFYVPIVGWSSSVQMSNSADTRVVAASAYLTANQTGVNTNASFVKVNLNAVTNDTHNNFDTVNGRYNITVPGKYLITAHAEFLSTNILNNFYLVSIYKNGSRIANGNYFTVPANTEFGLEASREVDLVIGDYIELYVYGQGNNSVSTITLQGTSIRTTMNIMLLSGPQAIAATEKIVAYGSNGNAQSLATSTDTTLTLTSGRDTHGIIDTTNNWIKIPTADDYLIESHIAFAVNSTGVRNFRFQISTNGGGAWSDFAIDQKQPSGSVECILQLTKIRRFNAGDLIRVRASQNSGGNLSLVSDGSQNYFGIHRI